MAKSKHKKGILEWIPENTQNSEWEENTPIL